MKKLGFALCIACGVTAAAGPSEDEVNARIQALINQRNSALDSVVVLQAQLVVLSKTCGKE